MSDTKQSVTRPQKKYGIYHWDTFDNETTLIHEEDGLAAAKVWIENHYGDRIRPTGADRCEIVEYPEGTVVESYSIG